jgi:hypothetical protein
MSRKVVRSGDFHHRRLDGRLGFTAHGGKTSGGLPGCGQPGTRYPPALAYDDITLRDKWYPDDIKQIYKQIYGDPIDKESWVLASILRSAIRTSSISTMARSSSTACCSMLASATSIGW